MTRRTAPADSATRMVVDGDLGSGTAARSLDFRAMGLPYLLPALAARRCLFSWVALGVSMLIQERLVDSKSGIGGKGLFRDCLSGGSPKLTPFSVSTHLVSKKWSGSADCIVGLCLLCCVREIREKKIARVMRISALL